MTTNIAVTNVLNGVIEVIKTVIPISVSIQKPTMLAGPYENHAIGVFVGMTGDLPGRLIISGSQEEFSRLGTVMFGMPIEGAMIESFAGEVGNMIAGNLSSNLAQKQVNMDITPPTVIVGDSKLYGFDKAILLPIEFDNVGKFLLVLSIDN